MEEQEQKEFISWLATQLSVESDQELETKLKEMGQEGIKKAFDLFQKTKTQKAQMPEMKTGGILGHLKRLNKLQKGGAMTTAYVSPGGNTFGNNEMRNLQNTGFSGASPKQMGALYDSWNLKDAPQQTTAPQVIRPNTIAPTQVANQGQTYGYGPRNQGNFNQKQMNEQEWAHVQKTMNIPNVYKQSGTTTGLTGEGMGPAIDAILTKYRATQQGVQPQLQPQIQNQEQGRLAGAFEEGGVLDRLKCLQALKKGGKMTKKMMDGGCGCAKVGKTGMIMDKGKDGKTALGGRHDMGKMEHTANKGNNPMGKDGKTAVRKNAPKGKDAKTALNRRFDNGMMSHTAKRSLK